MSYPGISRAPGVAGQARLARFRCALKYPRSTSPDFLANESSMYDPYDKNVFYLGDPVKSKQEIAADGPGWLQRRRSFLIECHRFSRHAFPVVEMNPDKLFDYLEGRLPASERVALEEQLMRDEQLQREFAVARQIHAGMR